MGFYELLFLENGNFVQSGVYTEGSGSEPGDAHWDTGGALDCTTLGVRGSGQLGADPHPGHAIFRREPFVFRENCMPPGDLGEVCKCSLCLYVCMHIHTYIRTHTHMYMFNIYKVY